MNNKVAKGRKINFLIHLITLFFWIQWLSPTTLILKSTGLKNGWTCALKLWGSFRHSIFKIADDE